MIDLSVLPLGAVQQPSAEAEALITRTAERIEPHVPEIAVLLIDRVSDEMELDPGDEELREQLVAAARGSVALITVMARSWTDPRVVPPPHDALLWARGLVARGLTIDALLRVYRIGQSGYEAVWFRELAGGGTRQEVVLESISAVSAFIATWVDAISTPLVEAYEDERARRSGGSSAVRLRTIERILDGQPVDVPLASARLGYELHRRHIALVGWDPADAADTGEESLDGRLAEVAATLTASSGRPLVVRVGPQLAAAWTAGDPAPGPDAFDAARVRARALGVDVGLGEGGTGLEGFRRSHAHALRARRIARLLRRSGPLTRYGDVAVLDLLTRDPTAAREFAAGTLGPLAEPEDGARRLLATLQVFLDEGQSYARAARRLGVHENTVAYRVRRAYELTHAGPEDAHALRTAISLAPLITAERSSAD